MTTAHTGTALMLVCVGRAADHPEAGDPGLVRERGLAALTTPVDLADFTGERGETNLADLDWVGPRAVAHDQAIDTARARGPVLPVAFGGVFSGPEAVAEVLRRNGDAIADFLDRTDAASEIAVRVAARLDLVERRLADATAERAAPTGAAYLMRRRAARDRRAEANAEVARRCSQIAARLTENARQAVARRVITADRDDHGTQVANWAFLVDDLALERFASLAAAVGESLGDELTLTVSGPWPPYSFCPALA